MLLFLTSICQGDVSIAENSGYELFYNEKQVSHEPQWGREQAIKHFIMMSYKHKHVKVEGRYNGEGGFNSQVQKVII